MVSEQQMLIERAEVILNNLTALQHTLEDRFLIPHDDVVVSIQTAVFLLRDAQNY